ncbi:dynein regulatory complex protein 9-like [Uranotaenia lowii]|uniref:dynein regulatory complex protein 9-like n=1 Tax=Uranotaenia lowii TaxID=190385 RepID=UPI002478805E|nr:dynein regulatory complex protein 9-like [Uranotaenia lowii]
MVDTTEDIFAGDSPEDVETVKNMIEKIKLEIMAYGEEEHDSYDPESLQKVEFNIQINRVTLILQEMSEMLEVLFCLPVICRDQPLLDKFFGAGDQDILKLLCKYIRTKEDPSSAPEVANLADFQYHSNKLIEVVEMVSNKDLHKAIVSQVKNLPGIYRKFLSNIREFRKFTITKMKMTAQKDLAKEKILHRMWQTNERNMKEIDKIEQILRDKQASFQAEVEEKKAIIEKFHTEIKQLDEQSKAEINAYIEESDRKMFRYFERSDQRYETLQEDTNRRVKEYQAMLAEDLRVEKENRLQKAKLTQQLKLLLNKYDKDAGERTHELNALADTLRARQEELDEWKRTVFDPQEKRYFEAIEERRLDEIRAHQEQVRAFMMNRAAKVLQRAWRSVAERKRKQRGRRGGRRGKGKK